MALLIVAGGDIFIDGQNVGSTYSSPIAVNGRIVAHPPSPGESFLGWIGDTDILGDPNAELTSFSLGDVDKTVTADNSDTSPPISATDYAILDTKLDLILVDTTIMIAGGV